MYIVIIIITKIRTTKAETEQEKRRERAERDTYLASEGERPLLRFPGFSALFYTICAGGHQRSPLSPIRSIVV